MTGMAFDSGGLPSQPTIVRDEWETIIPLRDQILIKPDEFKSETKGGIVLPDSMKIPVFTGRVLAVSWFLQSQYAANEVPAAAQIRELDRVIFSYHGAMPTEVETKYPKLLISIANVHGKLVKEGKRK